MNKILLIIQREYLTRVRKKAFLIMTFVGPILMAAMIIGPAFIASWSEPAEKQIAVLDETGWFFQKFKNEDNLHFYYVEGDLESEKTNVLAQKDHLLLYIPLPELNIPVSGELYGARPAGLNATSYIKNVMKQIVENKKLLASGIDPDIIRSSKVEINLVNIKVEADGMETKSYSEVESGLSIFGGIMIYFFIFLFGAQVLKGVIEEKSNRIVEVIISSVKPFQLMMGKIVGIALVGLTQFLLWIILTLILVGGAQFILGQSAAQSMELMQAQQQLMDNVPQAGANNPMIMINDILGSIDLGVMVSMFIFYFLGGYLIYSSFFAAIGGAVDHDADTQQFMFPVSIPLIFAVAMSGVIVNQPDSSLAFWMSIIPLTSPITMMMRLPFGVPIWQIGLSMALLIAGFLMSTWAAGKIYRTGILLYGKKITYATLWKWLITKQ